MKMFVTSLQAGKRTCVGIVIAPNSVKALSEVIAFIEKEKIDISTITEISIKELSL